MTSEKFKGGKIYSVLQSDIEYIGYFYAGGGKETVKSAFGRISKLRGRAPDFLMNAELFDFKTRLPASDVVCGGKVHRLTEGYGIAFPENRKAVFSYKNNASAKDYVGAYPTLIKGKKAENAFPAGICGSRGRTALGVSADRLFVALVPDSAGATLTELRNALLCAGCTDAINLDGGGSTQFYAPYGNFFSSRAVRGFIGIWIRGGDIRRVRVKTALNVREGAGIFYRKCGTLYNGDTVTVLEEKGAWSHLAIGWVSSRYLERMGK